MGFLQTSDDIASNVNKVASDVLNSKFTQFITGSGTPLLVTYFNIDDTMSTADLGTETPDKMLGEDSPFRFNRIDNLPMYGLRDILPSKEEIDMGLIDMSLDMETFLLPNTIKPNVGDYFVYRMKYLDTFLTFRVNDFEFTTIKSNGYYKLDISIKDINDDNTLKKVENKVVGEYTANLDNIGTQDKCIIENKVADTLMRFDMIASSLMEQYVDTFWDDKYNSFLYRNEDSGYVSYDPYLTEFLCRTGLVDIQDSKYIVLINYDSRDTTRRNYNKSIYRNIELQDKTKIHKLIRVPVSFPTTTTNPFYFYGEDTAFTIDLNIDYINVSSDKFFYVPSELIERIKTNTIVDRCEVINHVKDDEVIIENISDDDHKIYGSDDNTYSYIYWNLIIKYLNKDNCYNLLSEANVTMEDICNISVDYDYETYIYLPIIIYIIKQYMKFLTNNK